MTIETALVCTTDGCPCREWENDPDGTVRSGGHAGRPQCIGPVLYDDPPVSWRYAQTCTCTALSDDGVCWGCYLESK